MLTPTMTFHKSSNKTQLLALTPHSAPYTILSVIVWGRGIVSLKDALSTNLS